MAGTLIGVNTTLKIQGTGATYWTVSGTGDTSLLQVSTGQYAVVTGIYFSTLGTNTNMTVKLQETGGQQVTLVSASTSVAPTAAFSTQLYLGPGDKLIGIGTGGGANGRIWVIGCVFTNSP